MFLRFTDAQINQTAVRFDLCVEHFFHFLINFSPILVRKSLIHGTIIEFKYIIQSVICSSGHQNSQIHRKKQTEHDLSVLSGSY